MLLTFVSSSPFDKHLKFIVVDNVLIKENPSLSQSVQVISENRLLVLNNSFINQGQVIAQTELLSCMVGQISDIQESQIYNRRFLILTDDDKYLCSINKMDNSYKS